MLVGFRMADMKPQTFCNLAAILCFKYWSKQEYLWFNYYRAKAVIYIAQEQVEGLTVKLSKENVNRFFMQAAGTHAAKAQADEKWENTTVYSKELYRKNTRKLQ